jgi:hypothetical protein
MDERDAAFDRGFELEERIRNGRWVWGWPQGDDNRFVVLERALRDGPNRRRGGGDAEHVGDLSYPPEVVDQSRRSP